MTSRSRTTPDGPTRSKISRAIAAPSWTDSTAPDTISTPTRLADMATAALGRPTSVVGMGRSTDTRPACPLAGTP